MVDESNIKFPNIGKETSFEFYSTFNTSNCDRSFQTGDIIKTKMRHIKTKFSKLKLMKNIIEMVITTQKTWSANF